jgi:putative CocE/NonD family hydrolase
MNNRLFFTLFLIFSITTSSFGQADQWDKKAVMIPMRDGVKLFTKIYIPKNSQGDLPILIKRTPYGIGGEENFNGQLNPGGTFDFLSKDGYIFVFQDVRGKYGSEGEFVMIRPVARTDQEIDEGTDAYDTVDWLVKNVEGNNGRLGMFGISYDGWLTVMAALKPHPALKAVSPQASPADMFLMDDFSHNGAFRLSPTFGYTYLVGTASTSTPFPFDQKDTYEWYMDLGPIKNASNYLEGAEEGWIDFENHPVYDEFWQKQSVLNYIDAVKVPTLNVVGWWDAEDFYGSMEIYEAWEKLDNNNLNHLAVGPWRHGNWWSDGSKLGPLTFDPDPSVYYRKNIEAPFFKYHLKEEGAGQFPNAWVYQTGVNEWREFDNWPATDLSADKKLYLHPQRSASFSAPASDEASFSEYISDPANPVPYAPRPIPGFWQDALSKWKWKLSDQRFVQYRPDVLHFETEPLEEDIVISGEIVANFFASTTGTDADWVVKLIDVYPEDYAEDPKLAGYQLMVADEVLRGRFRNGFEKGEPIPPNEVQEYTLQLNNRHHRFRKGHKIMVQIQSTWFPLIDRNPQTFVNIFEAEEKDYQKATHRIYHNAEYPTHIAFPVLQSPKPIIRTLTNPEQYAGIFENESIGKMEVKLEDEQLVIYFNNEVFSKLEYVKGGLFSGTMNGNVFRVFFRKSDEGEVNGMKIMATDIDSNQEDVLFLKNE